MDDLKIMKSMLLAQQFVIERQNRKLARRKERHHQLKVFMFNHRVDFSKCDHCGKYYHWNDYGSDAYIENCSLCPGNEMHGYCSFDCYDEAYCEYCECCIPHPIEKCLELGPCDCFCYEELLAIGVKFKEPEESDESAE